jgi:hypothetical protein
VRELPNKNGFFPTIATFDAAKGTNKWVKKQKTPPKNGEVCRFHAEEHPKSALRAYVLVTSG